MRLLQNSYPLIKIDATKETEVMDQIQNGLKVIIDRIGGDSQAISNEKTDSSDISLKQKPKKFDYIKKASRSIERKREDPPEKINNKDLEQN